MFIPATYNGSFNIFMQSSDGDKAKLLRVGYGKVLSNKNRIDTTMSKLPTRRGKLDIMVSKNKHGLIKYGVIPYNKRDYTKVNTELNKTVSTGCLVLLGMLDKAEMHQLEL